MAERFPAYSGSGKYAFVSYSHKDTDKVYPVIKQLHDMGYNIWYDQGIPLVVDYGGELYKRILGCSIFMLFVSKNSVESKDVNKEFQNAASMDKTILRINIDNAPLPGSWAYHIPPTSQYASLNDEPSEFYSKVNAVLSKCRDTKEQLNNPISELAADTTPATASNSAKTEPIASEEPKQVTASVSASKTMSSAASKKSISPLRWPTEENQKIQNNKEAKFPIKPLVITASVIVLVALIGGLWVLLENSAPASNPSQENNQSQNNTAYPFEYVIANGEITITNCLTEYEGELVIPSEIDGIAVTAIGDSAFQNCSSLTSIIIPDSVISIGERAFYGCTDLTSITIPDGVTSIGNYMFRDCSSLTSITIPDGVTSIGSYAFQNCTALISITISDSVTSIDTCAFKNCANLTNIIIPDSVTYIGSYAFEDCSNLTSIYLSESITIIGESAFKSCTSLTSITLPSSMTIISSGMFSGCINLTDIFIPDSVERILNYAFSMCTSLTEITLPDSVTDIGSYAFSMCTNLTAVIIPDSVTDIGMGAFTGCTSVTVYCNFGSYAWTHCEENHITHAES